MEFTIQSRKLGKPVTFFCNDAGGYVFVDLNGLEGTLGNQICEGGSLSGSAIRHEQGGKNEVENLALFGMTCRAWFQAYLKNLRLYNMGLIFDATM